MKLEHVCQPFRDCESDKSIEQIGQETGADYILEATIRWDKTGEVDRIRISPRLTKTSDNYLMWADNFEQNMVHVFEVQSEIAEQITTALGLTLLEPEKEAPEYAPTSNMEAYNYYLRGMDLRSKGIFLANIREAISMFDSAIALDPDFAEAWAKKASAHTEYEFGYIVGDNIHDANAAREAAEKALQLDPRLPDAHIALGWYYNLIERDYERALDEFALAQSEVVANADLSEAIGHVMMRQGSWWEALEHFEKAARVDPLTVRRYYWLATCRSLMGDLDKAGQYIDRGLVLAPADGDAVAFRIFINLLQHGSVDSPERSFESIVSQMGIADASSYEFSPSHTLGLWRYIIDRVNPGEMIADLRAIREERSPSINLLNIAQIFDLTGQEDSARLYYDSTKTLLSEYVEQGSNDFHVYAPLGFAYAFLGMADSAIWAGKKGKELMPVDDCHW
jgi:tetratricopeptide (TPR) repeat protein